MGQEGFFCNITNDRIHNLAIRSLSCSAGAVVEVGILLRLFAPLLLQQLIHPVGRPVGSFLPAVYLKAQGLLLFTDIAVSQKYIYPSPAF